MELRSGSSRLVSESFRQGPRSKSDSPRDLKNIALFGSTAQKEEEKREKRKEKREEENKDIKRKKIDKKRRKEIRR